MNKFQLGDLIQIHNGTKYSHLEKGSIPLYGSGGIMSYVNDYLYDGEAILLPRKGTLNNIMYTNGKIWTVDTMYYATVRESVNPYYLFRYLGLLDLSYLDSGSTLPSMTKTSYNNLEINLPCLKVQNEVAKLLESLDVKIEINNKINQELEAMAKTIYDYWFVQFDFPNNNGEPYKSSGGLMVYNMELKKEIPNGWSQNLVSDWIKNDKSGDWGKDKEQGNYIQKVSCIRGADINGINGKGKVKTPTRFILEKNKHKILEPYDLVVEISGGSPIQSTGRLTYITDATLKRFQNPLICSNFCKALTLKDEKYLYNFVFQWNRLYDAGILFGWEGKTSGIKNLLFDNFVKNYKIVMPNSELIEKFYEFMTPIQQKIQTNLKENKKLEELRDWLLPMLMNGQVTVKQVEEQLAMVAEDGLAYEKEKDSIDTLFATINYDYEVATILLLTDYKFGFTYGKKFIHKMFSNIQFLNNLPVFENLVFQEKGWGMFSNIINTTINNQEFIRLETIDNGTRVLKVKPNSVKKIINWTNLEENKEFVDQVDNMLTIYENPMILKDMDRIELLNTVLECMYVLQTDDFQTIRNKMASWVMYDGNNKTKADKFEPNETLCMIDFIKSINSQ